MASSSTSPYENLLATTTGGVARSIDGGRTFMSVDGAPALLFVDWGRPDRALGVGTDGAVYVSEDRGALWSARGLVPGSPQAVTTHGDAEVYVATRDAIHRSLDGGATFEGISPALRNSRQPLRAPHLRQ